MSNPALHTWSLGMLLIWMIFTKFIKLSGHYHRRPSDCLLFPVSALFGYVHCFIKMTRGEIARLFSLPKPPTITKERKNSNFGPPTIPSTGRDQLATYHNTGYPSKRRKPEDPQSPFRDILQVAEPSGTALQNRERNQNIVSGRIVPEG
ncbi:hypothetical protein AJ78_03692 [Emergomyces pasteurianus Ep9510]|uniref:Uncharacterized protein n=1 Tax=Emergomyces pasteurianus Ep9510 TaxID=1447872 RepID=A0A1J9PI27_9EURO|nr:hypothetical protein AJ78_03692 [Emergomyces pasteurianus Ep9510]